MERNFFINLVKRIKKDDIFALTSQIAYGLVISFIPFLIFLMTFIGHLKLDPQSVLVTLKALMPKTAFEFIRSTVEGVVTYQNGNLLSVSLILTIWTASTGFRAVMKGMNKAYNQKETRNVIVVFIIAILFTIVFTLIIIASLVLLVFGNIIGHYVLRYLTYTGLVIRLWNLLRYSFIITMMVGVFALIYRYTPCIRLRWSEVIPGALIATLGWIITSLGFSFYVNNFSNYSKLYGGIAAVLILMTWIYMSSFILLIGGEINAYLLEYKEENEKMRK